MSKLRYFLLSMNILNGLLAAAVAMVVYFVVIPFLNPGVRSLPPAKKTAALSALSGEKTAPPQSSSPVDYAVISEQNLFHPERKIPLEKQPEKVVPRPEVFLYGTMIMDDKSFAFIEDKKAPYSTPGRSKRQITLKKGDSLNGYTLREIEANRIVFVKGEDKLVVTLDDRGKKRSSDDPMSEGMPSLPRAAAVSAQPSTLPAPGSGRLPQLPPAAPSPAILPVPGDAGSTPLSRTGKLLEIQKIKAGRQMSP